VPDGPSQAETDDAALIERRENSPAWADEEYATARTELFLAALALHKALIAAEAETFERNLGALMDLLAAGGGQPPPPEVALATWQSFFLVVPVARVAGGDAGSVFNGLGRGSLGWLLTASAGRLAPQQVVGGLWRPAVPCSPGTPSGTSLRSCCRGAASRRWRRRSARLASRHQGEPAHGSSLTGPPGTAPGCRPCRTGRRSLPGRAPLRLVRGVVPPVPDERDGGLFVYGAVTGYGSGVLPHLTTVIVPALSGDALPGA